MWPDLATPKQAWVDRLTLAETRRCLGQGVHFPEGSMAPKIKAIVEYLENGGPTRS